ncbi:MAG: 5-formyltetrahydrofolate cyclo-ligase [Spartobacteria bacterium]
MNDDVTEAKKALRMEMQQQLRALTAEDRQAYSEEICERVLEMEQWAGAQSVILFAPLPSEPLIDPLKLDCDVRKIACVTLSHNARSETDFHLPETIDLVLIPGLAFSQDRHRLGRGGGFFDRLLAGPAKDAFKLGICFSFQLLDEVPTEAHDILMDAVVSDQS